MHTHGTEDAQRLIREFRRRRRRFVAVTGAAFFPLLLFPLVWELLAGWEQHALAGTAALGLTGVALLGWWMSIGHRVWRCPACDRPLQGGFSPGFCHACGALLVPARGRYSHPDEQHRAQIDAAVRADRRDFRGSYAVFRNWGEGVVGGLALIGLGVVGVLYELHPEWLPPIGGPPDPPNPSLAAVMCGVVLLGMLMLAYTTWAMVTLYPLRAARVRRFLAAAHPRADDHESAAEAAIGPREAALTRRFLRARNWGTLVMASFFSLFFGSLFFFAAGPGLMESPRALLETLGMGLFSICGVIVAVNATRKLWGSRREEAPPVDDRDLPTFGGRTSRDRGGR